MSSIFYYGEGNLQASVALQLAKGAVKGRFNKSTLQKIKESSNTVRNIVKKGVPVYGINTGFGPLCTTSIDAGQTQLLQENILKSHAVGVGENLSPLLVKLMLVLKLHALAKGFSGVQYTTLQRIQWHLEEEVLPVVPCQGSVGASGDLAPLSHLFLPLTGYGEVMVKGKIMSTADALKKYQLKPLPLAAKEGLALINGTQFIAAHAVLLLDRFKNILDHADMAAAFSIEALMASAKPFFTELHLLRPYKGTRYVAGNIRGYLYQSEIVSSHINCTRVQDPYSLRCVPQVHGAARNAWLHLKEVVEIEINSVTDNPVIINTELTISGGNFHGEPLALPLDYACLAIAEIGNIADRRMYLLLEGLEPQVPKLLMKNTGINSGFMIVQYTTAALASECKTLCFPASADSIPTSLGQEDHVSMGSISGRKALQVAGYVEKILAMELFTAMQALDYHLPLLPSKKLQAVHRFVRKTVPHLEEDTVFKKYMTHFENWVATGELLEIAGKIKTVLKDADPQLKKYFEIW